MSGLRIQSINEIKLNCLLLTCFGGSPLIIVGMLVRVNKVLFKGIEYEKRLIYRDRKVHNCYGSSA